MRAGFDGVYLDTPLAYEELDLTRVPGQTPGGLARAMVDLIVRISRYAKSQRPGFLIVPQNSPELRAYHAATPGRSTASAWKSCIFRATDKPCSESYCAENLTDARALRAAGKFVLAVDYATRPDNIRAACARYRQGRFRGLRHHARPRSRSAAPCPPPPPEPTTPTEPVTRRIPRGNSKCPRPSESSGWATSA